MSYWHEEVGLFAPVPLAQVESRIFCSFTYPPTFYYIERVKLNFYTVKVLVCGIVMNSIVLFLASGFVSGVILIGFGEIIRLLHEMNERQKEHLK